MSQPVAEKKTRKARETKATNYLSTLAGKVTPVEDEYVQSILATHFKEPGENLSAFEQKIFKGVAAKL